MAFADGACGVACRLQRDTFRTCERGLCRLMALYALACFVSTLGTRSHHTYIFIDYCVVRRLDVPHDDRVSYAMCRARATSIRRGDISIECAPSICGRQIDNTVCSDVYINVNREIYASQT